MNIPDFEIIIVSILAILFWILLEKITDEVCRLIRNWFYRFRHLVPFLRTKKMDSIETFAFRPYELTKVDYKNYKGLFNRGINIYPKPRSGHRIVCNGSDLFCFGGFNPDIVTSRRRIGDQPQLLFRELWKFDLFTKKWQLVFRPQNRAMPQELASNAVCMKDDMIIVFGGTGYPFGQACSNKCTLLWPYKIAPTISLLETTGDKPLPQYGQTIMLKDRYLYVIGGTTGYNYSCDIYRLNLTTKEWKCISMCAEHTDDPEGRYRHEIAYDDKYIYVLGGGTSLEAYDLQQLPAFNLELSKWELVKTYPDPMAAAPGYPEPRKCHSCIQYTTDSGDIEVVIAGGYQKDLQFYDDVWKINLSTFKWQLFRTASLPFPLYFHDAATSGNGLMYVFGGIEVRDRNEGIISARTNEIYKMWVTIPKLSEISWEALMTCFPSLAKCKLQNMTKIGIPERFANRVDRRIYYSHKYAEIADADDCM